SRRGKRRGCGRRGRPLETRRRETSRRRRYGERASGGSRGGVFRVKSKKVGRRTRGYRLLPPAPRQLQGSAPRGVRKRLAHDRRGKNSTLCLEGVARARSDA